MVFCFSDIGLFYLVYRFQDARPKICPGIEAGVLLQGRNVRLQVHYLLFPKSKRKRRVYRVPKNLQIIPQGPCLSGADGIDGTAFALQGKSEKRFGRIIGIEVVPLLPAGGEP